MGLTINWSTVVGFIGLGPVQARLLRPMRSWTWWPDGRWVAWMHRLPWDTAGSVVQESHFHKKERILDPTLIVWNKNKIEEDQQRSRKVWKDVEALRYCTDLYKKGEERSGIDSIFQCDHAVFATRLLMGCGIESTSWKYGMFNEIWTSVERACWKQ